MRLSSGDEEVICERAASGVASFLSLFFHLVFRHQGYISWWLVGGISSLAHTLFFIAILLFFSSACSCGLEDDGRYGEGRG